MTHRALVPLVALGLTSCADSATSPFGSLEDATERRGAPTVVVDLGTLGGAQSFAWDINDQAVVVGGAETADGALHAFRWTKSGGMKDLGTLGGKTSNAVAINRRGFIAGTSTDAAGTTHLVMWNPHGDILDRGVAPGPPDAVLNPMDINDRLEIVGDYYPTSGENQVFHWTEATGITFYPWHPGEAYAGGTNTHRDVVGMFCCGIANVYGVFFSEHGEGFQDLGGITDYNAFAAAITDHRVIVGWDEHDQSIQPAPYWLAPFRWTATGGFSTLGTLGGDYGYATDVNDHGEVVGHSGLTPGEVIGHAFYWSETTGMKDLGPGRPAAINVDAQIVGVIGGVLGGGPSVSRAVMWIGTGGIASTSRASLRGSRQQLRTASEDCVSEAATARSKSSLLRCLYAAARQPD
jgi:probable HAF family extracellular repeat protein